MSDRAEQTVLRQVESPGPRAPRPPRAALVVIHGPRIGSRFVVDGGCAVLGRDSRHADVLLPDPAVSGRHAELRADPDRGRYELSDLGSSNGTFVNGEPIKTALLRDGDRLFLGDTVLKFTLLDAIEDRFHDKLDRLINVDDLTGLYLKRFFDAELERRFDDARRQGGELAVLMMDMDGLKSINDSTGHQMGSFCIGAVGRIVREEIDPWGIACRFGGDEFVACVAAPLPAALEIAETIRRRVEGFEFERDGTRVHPTISIGVAALGGDLGEPTALEAAADAALYRAKRAGRNTVSQ